MSRPRWARLPDGSWRELAPDDDVLALPLGTDVHDGGGRLMLRVTAGALGYSSSPELAALESWPAAAGAHVVSVRREGRWAVVVVDTDPSRPVEVHCEEVEHGWVLRHIGRFV